MLHTNCGELALLFDTYCRVWRAGGQASLTTSTKDGMVEANLKIQLGPPAAAWAGAPPPSQRWSSPSSSPGHPGAARRPCHRGPAAKAKSRARAALHQAAKAAAASAKEVDSSSLPGGATSPPAADHTPASGEMSAAASTEPVEVPPPPPASVPTPPPPSQDLSLSAPVSGGTSPPATGYISPVPFKDERGLDSWPCCGRTFTSWYAIDQHKKYNHAAFYIPDDRLLPFFANGSLRP